MARHWGTFSAVVALCSLQWVDGAGTVVMSPAAPVFSEMGIRTSGNSVAIELTGDSWVPALNTTTEDLLLQGMATVCVFDETSADAWTEYGEPIINATTRCPYTSGFRFHIADLVDFAASSIVGSVLTIALSITPGYDIPADEVVVIELPVELVASGELPTGYNRLHFVVKAARIALENTNGVRVPGVPTALIQAGGLPALVFTLSHEVWNPFLAVDAFVKGFCGATECSGTGSYKGFDTYRSTIMPAAMQFEDAAGQACPPNCPATVASIQLQAEPNFELCPGETEEVLFSADTLVTSFFGSSPPGMPSPVSPADGLGDVLGFNITGPPLEDGGIVLTATVGALPFPGPEGINENLIRFSSLEVSLALSHGVWAVERADFSDLMVGSVGSSLPANETLSFSSVDVVRAAMPAAGSDYTVTPDGKNLSFKLQFEDYDIPARLPSKCNESCPWSEVMPVDDTFGCGDGSSCNGATHPDGMLCCQSNAGIVMCPQNWPFMCADPWGCSGGYCCTLTAEHCTTAGHGGIRSCDASNCLVGETVTFDLPAAVTSCGLSNLSNTLAITIQGASWDIEKWFSNSTTLESLATSASINTPISITIEGTELSPTNDSVALSVSSCDDASASFFAEGSALTAVRSSNTSVSSSYPVRAGPGQHAVAFETIAPAIPGMYRLCYKDARTGYQNVDTSTVLTVFGKAFSVDGAAQADGTYAMGTVEFELQGEGLCSGPSVAGGAERTWGHRGQGCDSVKFMAGGDADCNPGYPVRDDETGMLGVPVPLRTAQGNTDGYPKTRGMVAIDLVAPGNFTVCYLSNWAKFYQRVGVVSVGQKLEEWSVCAAGATPGTTPYSTPPCPSTTNAAPGVEQTVYFKGHGLTHTTDPLGMRKRHRVYSSLGQGSCFPTQVGGSTVLQTCSIPRSMTVDECAAACDETTFCDAIQHNQADKTCLLQFPEPQKALHAQALGYSCDPDPAKLTAMTRQPGALTTHAGPPLMQCLVQTDEELPDDTGDEVMVVREGAACDETAAAAFVAGGASRSVNGEPEGTQWDSATSTCKRTGSTAPQCRTTAVKATWVFLSHGRYTFCYKSAATGVWSPMPGQEPLFVAAEVAGVAPAVLQATGRPPKIDFYGAGFADGLLDVRFREWPLACDDSPGHPGVAAGGWEEEAAAPKAISTAASNAPDFNVTGMQRTEWAFAAPNGTTLQSYADVPYWWAQAGVYQFCYRTPNTTGDWKPAGVITVRPKVQQLMTAELDALPVKARVSIAGYGLDTRKHADAVIFVPAVLGTCKSYLSDPTVLSESILLPADASGFGSRGLKTIEASGLLFQTAGVYRTCYVYPQREEYPDQSTPRACAWNPGCGSAPGNCCPNDQGLSESCCGDNRPSAAVAEVLSDYSCLATTVYPDSWPDWYIRQLSGCIADDDVSWGQQPWPPTSKPPCPTFYCGLLRVKPVVGAMVVENHAGLSTTNLNLDLQVSYRFRFDGQGFTEGDGVFILDGLQATCVSVDPVEHQFGTIVAHMEGADNPWDGTTGGLSRAYWNASFTKTGAFTVCLSFQFYPGLFVPAGTFRTLNTVEKMEHFVDASGSLYVRFIGMGLDASADKAMLILQSAKNCSVSNAKAQSGVLKGSGNTQVLWNVVQDLEIGLYLVCYQAEDQDWMLLPGVIEVPLGNVQPGFVLLDTATDFGRIEDLRVYGVPGLPLTLDLPFAENMTTAVGGLEWLPREASQTLTFSVDYAQRQVDDRLFASSCVTRVSACLQPPFSLDQVACEGNPYCAWTRATCRAHDQEVCESIGSEQVCGSYACDWILAVEPSIVVDGTSANLTFTIPNPMYAGLLDLRVYLVDDGGIVDGGRDSSDPVSVTIRITEGPVFSLLVSPVTMVEDIPLKHTRLADFTSAWPSREYSFDVSWPGEAGAAASTYFPGGFTVDAAGTLTAYPGPDRWVSYPGVTGLLTLRDITAGGYYQANVTVVIENINDQPSVGFTELYAADPVAWWQAGRTMEYAHKILEIPSEGPAQCATLEAAACRRVYYIRGCPAEVTEAGPYDCAPFGACLDPAACSAVSGCAGLSVMGDVAKCIETKAIAGCSSTIPTECLAGAPCFESACAAVANSTLTLGIHEGGHQSLQELSASLRDASQASLFAKLPSLSAAGVLAFTLEPTAQGPIELAISIKDSGGTDNGGSNSFTLPQALTIKTFSPPVLKVTPSVGGVALTTAFVFEAVGEATRDFLYEFFAVANAQADPVGFHAGYPISLTPAGPAAGARVTTSDLPPGEHTAVVKLYRDGEVVAVSQVYFSVSAPSASTVAHVVDGLATAGTGANLLPLISAAGLAARDIPAARTGETAAALLLAVLKVAQRLPAEASGQTSSAVLVTALTALRVALPTTVNGTVLLAAAQTCHAIKKKATGEGSLPGVLSIRGATLAGLATDAAGQLVNALKIDLAASYSVAADVLSVALAPAAAGLRATYTASVVQSAYLDAAGVLSSIKDANARRSVSLTQFKALYDSLRADAPSIDYDRATLSTSVRGRIALSDFRYLSYTASDLAKIESLVTTDLSRSFSIPESGVVSSLTAMSANVGAILFTVVATGAPGTIDNIICALDDACTGETLDLKASDLKPNGTGTTYSIDTTGSMVITDVDLRIMDSRLAVASRNALQKDIANAHSVSPEAVTVTLSPDASSGGSAVVYHVDSAHLADPSSALTAVEAAFRGKSVALPELSTAFRAAIDVDYSGTSVFWSESAPEEELARHFVEATATVLQASPSGPAPWLSDADKESALANQTERGRVNYALNEQFKCLDDVLQASCKTVLEETVSSRQDSRARSVNAAGMVVEWKAVLAQQTGAAKSVASLLEFSPGKNIRLTMERPSSASCFMSYAFTKSPFLPSGNPTTTPMLPVVAVRSEGLADISVSSDVFTKASSRVLSWNRDTAAWYLPEGVSMQNAEEDDELSIVWPAPQAASTARSGQFLLSGSDLKERIVAVAQVVHEHEERCLPCVLLSVLSAVYIAAIMASFAMHHDRNSRYLPLDDRAQLRECLKSRPTVSSAFHTHHAWLCFFYQRPCVHQYYHRWERATVWFLTYFYLSGLVALFYSADGIEPWQQPPDFSTGKCFAVGLLCAVIAFAPTLLLRYVLTTRERNWFESCSQDDFMQAKNFQKFHEVRWVLFVVLFLLWAGAIAVFVLRTVDYNTSQQISRYMLAWFLAVFCHFFLECFWTIGWLMVEKKRWVSKDHPRHRIGEEPSASPVTKKKKKTKKLLPTFRGDLPQEAETLDIEAVAQKQRSPLIPSNSPRSGKAQYSAADDNPTDQDESPSNHPYHAVGTSFPPQNSPPRCSISPPVHSPPPVSPREGLSPGIPSSTVDWPSIHVTGAQRGRLPSPRDKKQGKQGAHAFFDPESAMMQATSASAHFDKTAQMAGSMRLPGNGSFGATVQNFNGTQQNFDGTVQNFENTQMNPGLNGTVMQGTMHGLQGTMLGAPGMQGTMRGMNATTNAFGGTTRGLNATALGATVLNGTTRPGTANGLNGTSRAFNTTWA